MKKHHLLVSCIKTFLSQTGKNYIDLHILVHAVLLYQIVCHSDSLWLHWVFRAIIEVLNIS